MLETEHGDSGVGTQHSRLGTLTNIRIVPFGWNMYAPMA